MDTSRRATSGGMSLLVIVLLASMAQSIAGQPLITWIAPDGTLTWTNTSTQCVAVVEEFSPGTSGEWVTVYAELPTSLVSQVQLNVSNDQARFRVINADNSQAPTNMALIPGGWFLMGDSLGEGEGYEFPLHSVYVSPYYISRYEATNDEVAEALNWAHQQGKLIVTNKQVFSTQGAMQVLMELSSWNRIRWNGTSFEIRTVMGSGHPCIEISWYGAIAYCNFRSEIEGLTPCYNLGDWSCDWNADGFRLPTEAEWEKAARGGLTGERFPWGRTINHDNANYRAWSTEEYPYDSSPYTNYPSFHPEYDYVNDYDFPYLAPVGSFEPNGYGLHDAAGNVREWCWDKYDFHYYSSSPDSDPRGPSGDECCRVWRGGDWNAFAVLQRCSYRGDRHPDQSHWGTGLRVVRTP